MKKLPKDVQSLICASSQTNSFLKAVQELVYNSLDSNATSIAVRLNIEIGIIQVVDNGCGIQEQDFKYLGHKNMTSKFVDMSTLKSVPSKYGYKGISLSNLIQISQSVMITSRFQGTETTFVKIFKHGKEYQISETNTRPSKGTTVEIKGFLYNFGIQKKSTINVTELQKIKAFLEQLSLVHCGISISLRNDRNNEITFKIHKNRDIYQTLSILYGIERNNIQELQVEKSDYKVKAYIGKNADDVMLRYIFLNRKFITENSKLHKIVNEGFSKIKMNVMKNIKAKRIYNQNDEDIVANQIPFYVIFVFCPYTDYDLIDKSKEFIPEFKNWDQIKKLLEKLIKFFNGEIKVKEPTKGVNEGIVDKQGTDDTREQVRKIIDKILGSHKQKPAISQMQNGIKGKLIKRKLRKKNIRNISLSKIIPTVKDGHKLVKQIEDEHNPNIIERKSFKSTAQCQSPLFKHVKSPKQKKIKQRKKYTSLSQQFAMPTDSIKKRCENLAQETKALFELARPKISSEVYINDAVEYGNIITNNKNISIRKEVDEIIIRDYRNFVKPKQTEINNRVQLKKDFITTYDLVHTVLNTQQDFQSGHNSNLHAITNVSPDTSIQSRYNLINKELDDSSLPAGTFDSHSYGVFSNNKDFIQNNSNFDNTSVYDDRNVYNLLTRKKLNSFISKRSIENFSNSIASNRNIFCKKFKAKSDRRTLYKKCFMQRKKLFDFENKCMRNSAMHSSYTIELCDSHRKQKDITAEDIDIYDPVTISSGIDVNDTIYSINWTTESYHHSTHQNDINQSNNKTDNHINTNIENARSTDNFNYQTTYTIENTDFSRYSLLIDNDDEIRTNVFVEETNNINTQKTYTIESSNEISFENDLFSKKKSQNRDTTKNSINYVFVSTQDKDTEIIDPIEVCETIMNSQEVQKEFGNSFNSNDIINRTFTRESNVIAPHDNVPQNSSEEISHHFTLDRNIVTKNILIPDTNSQEQMDEVINKDYLATETDDHNFNIENRLCFLPKGLSPIFQNCNSKVGCSYNLNEDYYENKIYNDFAEQVQNQVEIFEPTVQKPQDLTTKEIDKVNNKMHKDIDSLKFDTESIKHSKVLGQVDAKFIAATIIGKSDSEVSEFLILFDQHAVHERIRLESNLSDYFMETEWKSVQLDEVSLKLSKDDITFLHNFKTKFDPLGLKWTIINDNEISITAIPEAILGKNPRPVDKILKSISNLIKEEISNIKLQGGCISLHPKSILDLVFSEACRYAIKFGDQLSRAECFELIKKLSDCKTPFQCAHGRPVMAVIMDIKPYNARYKIDLDKVKMMRK